MLKLSLWILLPDPSLAPHLSSEWSLCAEFLRRPLSEPVYLDRNYLRISGPYALSGIEKDDRILAASPNGRFVVHARYESRGPIMSVTHRIKDLYTHRKLGSFFLEDQRDDTYLFQFHSNHILGISYSRKNSEMAGPISQRVEDLYHLDESRPSLVPGSLIITDKSLPDWLGSMNPGNILKIRSSSVSNPHTKEIQLSSFKDNSLAASPNRGELHPKIDYKNPIDFKEDIIEGIEISGDQWHALIFVASGERKGYHLFDLKTGFWMARLKPSFTFFNQWSNPMHRRRLFSARGDLLACDDLVLYSENLYSARNSFGFHLKDRKIIRAWFDGNNLVVEDQEGLFSLIESDRESNAVLSTYSQIYRR